MCIAHCVQCFFCLVGLLSPSFSLHHSLASTFIYFGCTRWYYLACHYPTSKRTPVQRPKSRIHQKQHSSLCTGTSTSADFHWLLTDYLSTQEPFDSRTSTTFALRRVTTNHTEAKLLRLLDFSPSVAHSQGVRNKNNIAFTIVRHSIMSCRRRNDI